MKNIIVATLSLLLSTNAFACYDDKSLSIEDNLDNCLVDAEHGDASAQLFLGYIFSESRNYKEAVKWHRKAAEQQCNPPLKSELNNDLRCNVVIKPTLYTFI